MNDEYTNTAEQDACERAWAALNVADGDRNDAGEIDTERWKSHIGPLRHALRLVLRDAPEATNMVGWLEHRIETYAGHAAWVAQHAMDHHEVRWNRDHTEYTIHRTVVTVDTIDGSFDTGVLHGPAGRDIEWGCHPLPRFDHPLM